jgi:hypothetical protein
MPAQLMRLSDLGQFLKSVARHGVSLVMGGAVFMLLMFWERYSQRPVRPLLYWLTVAGAFLFATFRVWQDEKRHADTAERELARIRAAEAGLVTRKLTDLQFWLFSLIQGHGAHREHILETISGANLYALFIDEAPISHMKTQWLYDLVGDAVKNDLLGFEESRGIGKYSIPAPIEKSLAAYGRSERKIVTPEGRLYDARTGQPIEFSI